MALNGRVDAKKGTQHGIEIEDGIVLVTIYNPPQKKKKKANNSVHEQSKIATANIKVAKIDGQTKDTRSFRSSRQWSGNFNP